MKIDRRKFTKTLAASILASVVPVSARGARTSFTLGLNPIHRQKSVATSQHLAPFPAKQQILLEEYSKNLSNSPVSDTPRLTSFITNARVRFREVSNWHIGIGPNYSAAALIEGQPVVWVACYGSQAIYSINTDTNETRKFPTGADTSPLDVAYDSTHRRMIVASADQNAAITVLNTDGSLVWRDSLAKYTEQGGSDGGAQGVAVDAAGNYWFTLSYHGIPNAGVVMIIDGITFRPIHVVRNVGMNNPNGVTASANGQRIYVFSDVGVAHEFDLDANLMATHTTVSTGYRGAVDDNYLWTCAWVKPGKMSRVNLNTGKRNLFPCIDRANTIAVDESGYVWVAGDAGISVSDPEGALLATLDVGVPANGLSVLGKNAFVGTYDSHLRLFHALDALTFIPWATRGGTSISSLEESDSASKEHRPEH